MTFSHTSGGVTGRSRSVVLVDQTALNLLLSGRTGDLKRTMSGLAGTATVEARRLADQRLKPGTGRYKRSIKAAFRDPQHFTLEADVPYAATLELGSRPHVIQARRRPLLYFWWEKRAVQFSGPLVHHPGNVRPKLILTDAIQLAARRLGL